MQLNVITIRNYTAIFLPDDFMTSGQIVQKSYSENNDIFILPLLKIKKNVQFRYKCPALERLYSNISSDYTLYNIQYNYHKVQIQNMLSL